jgi:Clp amino terminal domain, pathogenicity island component
MARGGDGLADELPAGVGFRGSRVRHRQHGKSQRAVLVAGSLVLLEAGNGGVHVGLIVRLFGLPVSKKSDATDASNRNDARMIIPFEGAVCSFAHIRKELSSMEEPTIRIRNSVSSQWLTGHRFTDPAMRIVRDAETRGLHRGLYGELPAVLMLWSMLRWERNPGIVALERLGVDILALERDIDVELRPPKPPVGGCLIDMVRLKTIATQAAEEAALIGDDFVGPEHLLLAMCRESDEGVRRVLHKHGLTAGRCTQSLKDATGKK